MVLTWSGCFINGNTEGPPLYVLDDYLQYLGVSTKRTLGFLDSFYFHGKEKKQIRLRYQQDPRGIFPLYQSGIKNPQKNTEDKPLQIY